MKKSRFVQRRIAFALNQAEAGARVPEARRKTGISEPTIHRWKQRFGTPCPLGRSTGATSRPSRGGERPPAAFGR